jgi:hypothetical protein
MGVWCSARYSVGLLRHAPEKAPPEGAQDDKTRQDKGESLGNYCKYLKPGGKPPEGRAIDGIMLLVMPASMFMFIGLRRHDNQPYGRSQSFWWTRGCGPTTSQSWVLVSLVLCAALHSIPPPPHPPVQVCHVALVLAPATVSVSGFVVVDVGFAFLLLCSSIIIKHGLPPPSFGLARWHTRQCAPAQPPFCGLACVL